MQNDRLSRLWRGSGEVEREHDSPRIRAGGFAAYDNLTIHLVKAHMSVRRRISRPTAESARRRRLLQEAGRLTDAAKVHRACSRRATRPQQPIPPKGCARP